VRMSLLTLATRICFTRRTSRGLGGPRFLP
jgi:hypothetical protein